MKAWKVLTCWMATRLFATAGMAGLAMDDPEKLGLIEKMTLKETS